MLHLKCKPTSNKIQLYILSCGFKYYPSNHPQPPITSDPLG